MELRVKFMRNDGSKLVYIPTHQIGLKMVDKIREETGCNLPLERIDDIVDVAWNDTISIEVPEDMARRSGHFETSSRCIVKITSLRALNGDYEMVPEIKKDDNTGEILSVKFKWELNEKFLLEQWEAAGFPLEWDPMTTPV